MHDENILTGTVLDEACLTVEEIASVCSVSTEWVVRHVEEGVFSGLGGTAAEWRFSSRDLWRVRHIYTLERNFDAAPELAALVADLLEELDTLRTRMRRAGVE